MGIGTSSVGPADTVRGGGPGRPMATFGTPADVTSSEPAIESFYPLDELTTAVRGAGAAASRGWKARR